MIEPNSIAENSLAVRRACNELSRQLREGLAARAEQFLAAEPLISSDTDAALELLYTEFVVREQLGQRPQPQEWLDRFPQWREELLQLFEVHALVDNNSTWRAGLSGTHGELASEPLDGDGPAAGHFEGQMLGGYEILQEIGRGGMGVVYRARQRGLGRIVALKMILPPHGPRERERFRAEAEATARLSHPNIVPIYEVGQDGDCPFLSMEFVDGQGLDKQLADSLLAPRAAAELLLTLARAVAYAHDKGIIHRDLKPANIVLAGDGAPKITDFGLARQLAPADVPPGPGSNGPPSVAIVGTPSYMAPEQCSPGTLVGPPADVYALGAILYEALTGRPPFRGQTALDILELVRSQEPVPPSRLVSKAPRDLETICLKCLAKQPQQRYAGAAALADDLRRFLAGEPILARPVGRTERAIRWCQRNPAVAALAAGIVLALVCGTAVSTSLAVWALSEKDRATEHARQASVSAQREKTARALAEFRFSQAERAVEQYLDGIENNQRLKEADFFEVRKQLLASALPFYEEFVQQKPGDAALEAKRGLAYGRLGALRTDLGELDGALADLRRRLAIFQKLSTDFPDVAEYRQGLGASHNDLGRVLRGLGDRQGTLAEHQVALDLLKRLTTDFPAVREYRKDLALSHSQLGTALLELRKYTDAKAELLQGLAIQQQLVEQCPEVAEYRDELAVIHNSLGVVLNRLGDEPGAESEYRLSLALRASLAADFPAVPRYRSELAQSHYNLGIVLRELKKEEAAELEYRKALPLLGRLAVEFPAVPHYRYVLAATHANLGFILARFKKHADAEVEYRQALAMKQRLVADFPNVPLYLQALATSRQHLGGILAALGKPAEAEAEFREALSGQAQLIEQNPDNTEHRTELARWHYNFAVWLWEQKKREEAEVEFRETLAIRKQLAGEFPAAPQHRRALARAQYNLGLALARVGKFAEAESEYVQAIALRKQLVAEFPDDLALLRTYVIEQKTLGVLLARLKRPAEAIAVHREAMKSRMQLLERAPEDAGYLDGAALTLGTLASLSRKGGELDEARRLYSLAADYQLKAHQAAPTNATYADSLREYYHRLGDVTLQQQDHAAAADAARRLAEVRPDAADDAELAARIAGRCVTLAEQDTQLPEAERLALAQSYADQAMEHLHEAVRRGYDDVAALKTLTSLAPLRDRQDFQQLVEELETR